MDFLESMNGRVTNSMNLKLSKEYKVEEVFFSHKQMHPMKSPSLYGMNHVFFQKNWHIKSKSVIETVLRIQNSGQVPNELIILVAMISKRKQAVRVWKFRPINLCNMVYKLVSTVVANRLKLVLPHVMSYSQSAFVPRRQITDNVLVAYELVHFLRRKRKRKQGFMSIKLDINKAYDQVEWSYLDRVMELMSF